MKQPSAQVGVVSGGGSSPEHAARPQHTAKMSDTRLITTVDIIFTLPFLPGTRPVLKCSGQIWVGHSRKPCQGDFNV